MLQFHDVCSASISEYLLASAYTGPGPTRVPEIYGTSGLASICTLLFLEHGAVFEGNFCSVGPKCVF